MCSCRSRAVRWRARPRLSAAWSSRWGLAAWLVSLALRLRRLRRWGRPGRATWEQGPRLAAALRARDVHGGGFGRAANPAAEPGRAAHALPCRRALPAVRLRRAGPRIRADDLLWLAPDRSRVDQETWVAKALGFPAPPRRTSPAVSCATGYGRVSIFACCTCNTRRSLWATRGVSLANSAFVPCPHKRFVIPVIASLPSGC